MGRHFHHPIHEIDWVGFKAAQILRLQKPGTARGTHQIKARLIELALLVARYRTCLQDSLTISNGSQCRVELVKHRHLLPASYASYPLK